MKKNSIIIITLVILLVIGVWLLKNFQNPKNEIAQNINSEEESPVNEDFKLNITGQLDLEKLKSYKIPIIIDFGADYCMPCRSMEKDFKKVNKDMQGEAIVRYVDVWKYPEIAEIYQIELIPTQILFNSDGTPYKNENLELEYVKDENGNHIYTKHTGVLTESNMKKMIEEMKISE